MFCVVREIAYGVITSWSGGLEAIPPGWQLCDGTNGTPDLRDKFVPCAGPTFAVGSTAGAIAHDHSLVGFGHTHPILTDSAVATGSNYGDLTADEFLTGSTDSTNSLPTYYALAYIMNTS